MNLVVEVLQLGRSEVLLAEIPQFHLIFAHVFCHNQPGIRVS